VGIDLFILGLILVFGLLGMAAGAAKQIAQIVALVAAYATAGPLGRAFGPNMAKALGGVPVAMGTVAAMFVVFVVVLVALRFALTAILRRAMAGDDDEDERGESVDRNLGLAIGATKVALMAYVVVCALVFAEKNVTAFGKKLGVSPKDSIAFDIARKYNLFEMTQFSEIKELARVANAVTDPKKSGQLEKDPAFQALKKDPRFQKVIQDQEVRRAAERGDYQALLRSNAVMQLLSDPDLVARIEAAASAAER
jgi:membrane protein required for colicin V production